MSSQAMQIFQAIKEKWSLIPVWLQSIIFGVLLGVSFVQPYFAPLIFIGLIGCWWLIIHARTIYQAVWYGWLVWYIKSVFVMSWLWSTYPLVWVEIGDSMILQLSVITFYLLTIALWLSITGIVIGISIWYIHRLAANIWLRIGLGVMAVVAAELMASSLFSIASLASNIPVTSGLSYGLIGLPLALWPGAIGWSIGFGLYGLSAVVATYTLGAVWIDTTRRNYWLVSGLLVVSVGGVVLLNINQYFSAYDTEQSPMTIAVIETDFTAELHQTEQGQETKRNLLKEAFAAAMNISPGYVIFPEGTRFTKFVYPHVSTREAYNYLRLEYDDFETVVIDSTRIESPAGAILRATMYDGVTKTVSQVDKQYLVPQGEYMPYFYSYVFKKLGYSELVDDLVQERYVPGPYINPTYHADHLPAILFCFASSHTRGVADVYTTDNKSVPFVAHVISHSWFHHPILLWHQTDQFLRIQAVWNQVPIVSAGNMAPSKVYWSDGSVSEGEVIAEGELWRVRLVTLP